jgi:hypothetical protein
LNLSAINKNSNQFKQLLALPEDIQKLLSDAVCPTDPLPQPASKFLNLLDSSQHNYSSIFPDFLNIARIKALMAVKKK